MKIPVYNLSGEVVEQIEVDGEVFGIPFNQAVVHQALVRQLANRRQGTVSTKTRRDVVGSTRKLYAQKGTGRARRGDIKSPLLRGGGVVFGPKPRDYGQSMPRKMRQLALKCVLSAKVEEEEMKIVKELVLEIPKTREMSKVLSGLAVEFPMLLVTEKAEAGLVMASRNLQGVKVLPSSLVNVLDLMSCHTVLVSELALRNMERLWGKREKHPMETRDDVEKAGE